MEQLPKQLVIIGGGVIASEIASSMADLDVDVTILERAIASYLVKLKKYVTIYQPI